MEPRADLVDATLATIRERGIVGTSPAALAEAGPMRRCLLRARLRPQLEEG